MGAQRTTFEKLQRDRAKKAKAAMKRARRQDKEAEEGAPAPAPAPDTGGPVLTAAQLLARIEQIHTDLQRGTITQEEFEEHKADLLSRLPVD